MPESIEPIPSKPIPSNKPVPTPRAGPSAANQAIKAMHFMLMQEAMSGVIQAMRHQAKEHHKASEKAKEAMKGDG